MKSLAAQQFQGFPGLRGELAAARLKSYGVDRIAHNGVADVGQMNPDLMSTPGFEFRGEAATPAACRRYPSSTSVTSKCVTAWRPASPFTTAMRVRLAELRPDAGLDGADAAARRAPHEGEVCAPQAAVGAVGRKLLGEAVMRGVRLGHHEQARSLFVEAVNNARALDAADTGEAVAAMGDERIDERAAGVAGRGVNDEPCRLVDNDEVSILVSDRERDDFALRLRRLGRRNNHSECLGRFDPQAGVTYRSLPVLRHARTGSGPEGASGSYPAAARTGHGPRAAPRARPARSRIRPARHQCLSRAGSVMVFVRCSVVIVIGL